MNILKTETLKDKIRSRQFIPLIFAQHQQYSRFTIKSNGNWLKAFTITVTYLWVLFLYFETKIEVCIYLMNITTRRQALTSNVYTRFRCGSISSVDPCNSLKDEYLNISESLFPTGLYFQIYYSKCIYFSVSSYWFLTKSR